MARLGLYQPFIEDRNVRRLYQLKVWFRAREGRRVPMTVLVNRILDDFFDSECDEALPKGSPIRGLPHLPAPTNDGSPDT